MAYNPNWPPDYKAEQARRLRLLLRLKGDESAQRTAAKYYAKDPIQWINDWAITYNPRNKAPIPKTMPFMLFAKQEDFVLYLKFLLENNANGLVEKARDIGATWLCCAFSVWAWLYMPGCSIGWGSRKEQLVDRIGDPDSIFQKMRMIIQNLPDWMLPDGFEMSKHATYMKIINPETGSTITGEAGDNIGRGGRTTMYFKDESAHYEHPELVEAALGDNTDVQIDISSVNGTNNVFYRRRFSKSAELWTVHSKYEPGKIWIFIFDWSDHPGKNRAWYEERRQKAADEGLLHLFAQEVDRDYASSLERIIIPPAWVKSAIDAHIKLGWKKGGERVAMQDVADEGGDTNAFAARRGSVLSECVEWGEGDVGETAQRAVQYCAEYGIPQLYYDCIGVGAGVKSETNRLKRENKLPKGLNVIPWNAAAAVLDPTENLIPGDRFTPTNEDYFGRLKPQAWWRLRVRFEKTHKAVTKGAKYDQNEMISLPSTLDNIRKIEQELSQAQFKKNVNTGKMEVDKKPDGGKSPNLADAIVGCFCPTKELSILDVL